MNAAKRYPFRCIQNSRPCRNLDRKNSPAESEKMNSGESTEFLQLFSDVPVHEAPRKILRPTKKTRCNNKTQRKNVKDTTVDAQWEDNNNENAQNACRKRKKVTHRKKKCCPAIIELPDDIKAKCQELDDIDKNYQLHVTKESTTSSNYYTRNQRNKRIEFSSSVSLLQHSTTTNAANVNSQIETSTPAVCGRKERNLYGGNMISEFSCIERYETPFENSQLAAPPVSTCSKLYETCLQPNTSSESIGQQHAEQQEDQQMQAGKFSFSLRDDDFKQAAILKTSNFNTIFNFTGIEADQDMVLRSGRTISFSVESRLNLETSFSLRRDVVVDPTKEDFIVDLTKEPIVSDKSLMPDHMEIAEADDAVCDLEFSRIHNAAAAVQQDPTLFSFATPSMFSSYSMPSRIISRMSLAEACSPYLLKNGSYVNFFDHKHMLFAKCDQDEPLPWTHAISEKMLQNCEKIGEGTYGEVFLTRNHENESVAIKIVPIEGKLCINGEIQKTFEEILPEILIAKEMSQLRIEDGNNSQNFVELKKISCVQGPYPSQLLKAWDKFDADRTSENERPDIFDDGQLFIIFEFSNGGQDLEHAWLQSPLQAKSILMQLVLALAVAEITLEFEHRDLHIGNVLVRKTTDPVLTYEIKGSLYSVNTHGVHVFIIDFTNSRLSKDGVTVFTDLVNDEELFKGEGDFQFDIYRMMKELNNNKWKSFEPGTNLLWLRYIVDKLIKFKWYNGKKMSKKQKQEFQQFDQHLKKAELYKSCTDLIQKCTLKFFKNSLILED